VSTFQQIQSRLIWSSRTPNTNEYLMGGQAVTLVGRLGQVNKMVKFSHIKGGIHFLALRKVCNIMS